MFVVHSADDETVPIHHGEQLEAAAREADANATFWYIDGAGHVQAAGVYPEEFEARVVGFFEESLGR